MDIGATTELEESDRVLRFLRECAFRLCGLANEAPASGGAERFRRAVEASLPLIAQPSWLPVLDSIGDVDPSLLAQQFVDIAALLRWQPTFRTDDQGTHIALAPLNEVRTLDGVTVGLLYVGPGRQYPLHSHPPHELYLTIAGTAQWRYGGHTEFREVDPESVILNRPNDLHATIAGTTPLVALYVLWD